MERHATYTAAKDTPRLPLEGSLDLTYRCNNNCRHCWLRIPPRSPQKERELSFDEIRRIVDEARAMGCRRWFISGGEPMLRPDFAEILEYIASRSASYSLNTNGTLITPSIARLLTRKGDKMVALYGATAEVHDHITRHPGSFEATMQGFAYLKEAGAGFTVQLVPMRDNYAQYDDMVRLAESLSPRWRIGAPWLYLSADGDLHRNREIRRQRLPAQVVVELDPPYPASDEGQDNGSPRAGCADAGDDRLFAACLANRREFHIDPYGRMTFCSFIKDSALRFDLRKGSFQQGWDEFIPALADRVKGASEYLDGCAACAQRSDCLWCPAYGYLEHRRFGAKVDYLCAVASETRRWKDDWETNHRRYYQIAGITVQVDSDLPMTDATFGPQFVPFRTDGPGEDVVRIRHHFFPPNLGEGDLGQEVYRWVPWAIYRKGQSWIYRVIGPRRRQQASALTAVFNADYTKATFYHDRDDPFRRGGLGALTLMATDQLLLAQLVADREGCYLHSSGVVLDGKGLLFAGHSEAGKSTMVKMIRDHAEILCDDRIIVRRWPEGFRIHGTWSHGEVPTVSANSAPLRAILFLEKAPENRLVPLESKREILPRLLACLIKPHVTTEWWDKMLPLMERLADEVPCYDLRFDKSGRVVDLLKNL
jgi:MoaA/NifB/PqqE/SkfB family radical SAM enzyme